MQGSSQDSQVMQAKSRVLAQLKPFQRDTVSHIDRLFREGARRVLVADEVGLGKTLVAKGVVATTAALRKEEHDDFFKVVYVCSNAAIVNQNLAKLTVDERLVDRVDASDARLSMQHFASYRNERRAIEEDNYIQLIPLTPGTSFNVANGAGTTRERALLFATLRRMAMFADVASELESMFRAPGPGSWEYWRDYYERTTTDEPGYIEKMLESLKGYKDDLAKVADYLRNRGTSADDRRQIGKIRRTYALLSIEHLDPDLVIMDEFQRFRDLLDTSGETDMSIIASKFLLSQARTDDPVRVLLLSATPFKPFSTRAEEETFFGDSAADDFLRVVEFLTDGEGDVAFEQAWHDYGMTLTQYVSGDAGLAAVRIAKDAAQDGLRALMARTERDGMEEYADIVKDCTAGEHIPADRDDIATQLTARRLFEAMGVGQSFPTDYVESCPYLLSFLKGYKLGDRLLRAVERNMAALPFGREDNTLAARLWLQYYAVAGYAELDVPNSRFRALAKDVFETGAKRGYDASSLLWVPPSRPYYRVTEGPFAEAEGFSKTLVFSSWTMVPRMMATLLSYEDERRSVVDVYGRDHGYTYFDKDAERDVEEAEAEETDAKTLPSNRLRIKPAADKGAALLAYPATRLGMLAEWPAYEDGATLASMKRKAAARIKQELGRMLKIKKAKKRPGAEDPRWYPKAIMMLERALGADVDGLLEVIGEAEGLSAAERSLASAWRDIDKRTVRDMGRMPEVLFDVLAEVAIASPAVCAARTFAKCAAGEERADLLGFRLACAFLRKMNTPAATLAIESGCKGGHFASHWSRTLRYCALGNLQSVLDEYAHQLNMKRPADAVCADMVGENVSTFKGPSMYTMQGHYDVDTLQNMKRRAADRKADAPMKMRTGFAAAFIEDEGGGNNTNRRENMRRAFNSPFRPFVLCSTSVGQEGLDFHAYCRKIVHWNLPGNPIDMEQREGRINRYEGLAIRQNVARRNPVAYDGERDIWATMFDGLEATLQEGATSDLAGLAPHWGLPEYDDEDVRIERHAYLRKFGAAEKRYERLIDVLVRYRAVLGQPRQEELLAKLGDKLEEEGLQDLFMVLAPFNYEHQIGLKPSGLTTRYDTDSRPKQA